MQRVVEGVNYARMLEDVKTPESGDKTVRTRPSEPGLGNP